MSALLEARDVKLHFPVMGGIFRHRVGSVYAVDGVSFDLHRGETLGIVGESGCGKSTLGRTLVRLYTPTSGTIRFQGKDITALSGADLFPLRRRMQLIFQDPYSSLNPRKSIRSALEEPLRIHGIGSGDERFETVAALIEKVGLHRDDLHKFPHEFSGGQRQRIGIARALVLGPDLVVADEPVSALDVSIQSQVLNLLVELQKELGLTLLFISHDLTVVKFISDRVAVMYLGRIVEIADAADIYAKPAHPYTRALLASLPVPDPQRRRQRTPLEGDVPNPSDPPPGCAFHTRCPHVQEVCRQRAPELAPLEGEPSHRVACHFAEELRE
ncbi:MAG: dipeptide ABC transporter ATP-binding protein [Myxococcales bacterium]|nr:dipeptide ABC transporter ATP-binding protein [Myxococcales bacterium]